MLKRFATPYPGFEFISASGDRLSLAPCRGGLVTSWFCSGEERLYFDLNRFLDSGKSVRGGIPVLFPICGNLPGDVLVLPTGTYPMHQHGFARDLPWSLQSLDDGSGVELSLGHSDATLCHFPYPFRLSIQYRLEPSSLSITAEVQQLPAGSTAMPFSLGLHPYFAISALEAASVQGLPSQCFNHLTMEPEQSAQQLSLIPTGVDLLAGPASSVRLLDAAEKTGIELELTAPLDLAVVWSDPPRPMVCLEPWTAPRGSLVTGDRRLSLNPGESMRFHCRYNLISA